MGVGGDGWVRLEVGREPGGHGGARGGEVGVAFGHELEDALALFSTTAPGHVETFAAVENGSGGGGRLGIVLPAEVEDVEGLMVDAGFELVKEEGEVRVEADGEGATRDELSSGRREADFRRVGASQAGTVFAWFPFEGEEAPEGAIGRGPKSMQAVIVTEHGGDRRG